MIWRHLAVTSLIVASLFQTTNAQDWTQWRGPTRDGLVPAATTPAASAMRIVRTPGDRPEASSGGQTLASRSAPAPIATKTMPATSAVIVNVR